MSEIFQNNLLNGKQYCGAKTKEGVCKNLPMENGRCRLHGGLTPKKHLNYRAKFNALKTGRYSAQTKIKINALKTELQELDNLIKTTAA